jgi:enoyl-CoA hydratase/carnithine racemase
MEHFTKPLIAVLNGITLAGGLELAMTADLIIAAESAKIGDAHANFGVLPGAGGAVKLPRKIGINRAKYLLFTGEFISAAEMKDYGLVNQVVPSEELEKAAQALADKLAEKSPLGLSRMKQLVRDGLEQPLDVALRLELATLKVHTQSYDMSEGLKAFTEKRKPEFKGY